MKPWVSWGPRDLAARLLPPHEIFDFAGTPGLRSSVTHSPNALLPVLGAGPRSGAPGHQLTRRKSVGQGEVSVSRPPSGNQAGRPRRGEARAAGRSAPPKGTRTSPARVKDPGPPTPVRRAAAGAASRRSGIEQPQALRPQPPTRRRNDLIYGRNAVLEAARVGRVRRVLLAEGLDPDPRLVELRQLAPSVELPAPRLAALAQGAHQ